MRKLFQMTPDLYGGRLNVERCDQFLFHKRTRLVVEVKDAVVRLQKVRIR